MLNYISVGKKDDNEDSALMNVTTGNWLTYFVLFDFHFQLDKLYMYIIINTEQNVLLSLVIL